MLGWFAPYPAPESLALFSIWCFLLVVLSSQLAAQFSLVSLEHVDPVEPFPSVLESFDFGCFRFDPLLDGLSRGFQPVLFDLVLCVQLFC